MPQGSIGGSICVRPDNDIPRDVEALPGSAEDLALQLQALPDVSAALHRYAADRVRFADTLTRQISIALRAQVADAAYLVVAPGSPCALCVKRNAPTQPCRHVYQHPCVDGFGSVLEPVWLLDAQERPVTLVVDFHAIRLCLALITPMVGLAPARLDLHTYEWQFDIDDPGRLTIH